MAHRHEHHPPKQRLSLQQELWVYLVGGVLALSGVAWLSGISQPARRLISMTDTLRFRWQLLGHESGITAIHEGERRDKHPSILANISPALRAP